MSATPKRHIVRWLVVSASLVALVGGAVAFADPDESGTAAHKARPADLLGSAAAVGGLVLRPTPTGAGPPCGSASARTVASVYDKVALRIYEGEIHSREVRADIAHITGSQELLSALAASDTQAVHRAVYSIVYAPHWHIVRLRVTQNGRVLADVGGPYIIAPVSGPLTVNGKKVGTYTMSVQDDVGYLKLVSRFIGVPIDLYGPPRAPGAFLMGTLKPAPSTVSDGTTVEVGGSAYLARVLHPDAFPEGKLQATIFVPVPTRAQAAQSCQALRLAAWRNVVEHVAARFTPLDTRYQEFVGTLQGATASPAYVRIGNRQIAGLNAGPHHIPRHGTVKYRGATWHVFSWSPHPPARIYFLTPGG
jgi:drug/metabolite transporter superfamily protein YnfA